MKVCVFKGCRKERPGDQVFCKEHLKLWVKTRGLKKPDKRNRHMVKGIK